MRLRFPAFVFSVPAVLVLSGCGYVHLGRLPAPMTVTTVVGDEKLLKDNADLRLEKKLLQQELAITRAQGNALRMAIENRAADGDTSKRLVEKLSETSRELATLRANYATLQQERNQAVATAGEANTLKSRLGATEEQLAASLRTFTELQEEVTRLRTDVVRTRDENLALSSQVRTVTAQSDQAQAALAQLNTDLLTQKEARLTAEQDIESLRTELKTVAPNSSVLAQQRAGSAGQVRSLAGEHAAENIALKQQLDQLRTKVDSLESERTVLQKQLASAGASATPAEAAKMESQLVEATRMAALLREENSQLRATTVSQTQPLQEQLREAQARAVALTEENSRLKARIATARPVVPTDSPRIELGADASTATVSAPKTGSSSVNATLVASVPGGNRPGGKTDANGQRVHVVTGGDTLAKISALYYGTSARWGDILAANRDVLGESNNLVVGRPLRIP